MVGLCLVRYGLNIAGSALVGLVLVITNAVKAHMQVGETFFASFPRSRLVDPVPFRFTFMAKLHSKNPPFSSVPMAIGTILLDDILVLISPIFNNMVFELAKLMYNISK
jgi:hypothetical protein